MHVINVRNVHEALPVAIHYIRHHGIQRESRAGEVLIAPGPVTTLYQMPGEMCVLHPARDINPFASLFEGLWMLAGRHDLEYVSRFLSKMGDYSDDGMTMHGAYGHRWFHSFGFNQLDSIAQGLKRDSNCRRQVLQMWNPVLDLADQEGKRDLPCNTSVYFLINVYGALDITVLNRSNDLVWGTYGADAVHFAMLLQYMARKIGVPPGRYWQVSNNWHAYIKTLEPLEELEEQVDHWASRLVAHSPYETGQVQAFNIMRNVDYDKVADWEADLMIFLAEEDNVMGYATTFFKKIAVPMVAAHKAYKQKDFERAFVQARNIRATDWRASCEMWLKKRLEKAHG